jgi:2'-5' RNA ligase
MSNWFIALPVDPGTWFERVSDPPRGVRLFHPEDLHITVAFLGPVGEERARRAFAWVTRWPTPPLLVQLGAVVPMGRKTRPSALSAVLEQGAESAAAGILAVRDAMADAAEVPRETRPALPHVTLARPGRNAEAGQRQLAMSWAASLDLGAPRIYLSELALYTWSESRAARLFRTVERHRLVAEENPRWLTEASSIDASRSVT